MAAKDIHRSHIKIYWIEALIDGKWTEVESSVCFDPHVATLVLNSLTEVGSRGKFKLCSKNGVKTITIYGVD